jgi:hypothetical protein
MKETLKNMLKRTFVFFWVRNRLNSRRQRKEVSRWEKYGRPCPPPHLIKQEVLKRVSQECDLRIFVETGTFYGDMVEAMRKHFDHVYSIELSVPLYEMAKMRFASDTHVEIIQGDSGVELGKLMGKIDQSGLFWLDGHYSAGVTARGVKDCPVLEELAHILTSQRNHVIIIDDARCFGNDPGYPTMKELIDYVHQLRDDVDISVELDSIRILPQTVKVSEGE